MVRVAAIDANSTLKALITLTAANNMIAANAGQMLVFQPQLITAAAAEPPKVPEGSLVMYTSHIMQGACVGGWRRARQRATAPLPCVFLCALHCARHSSTPA
jgi:hypothetical protein